MAKAKKGRAQGEKFVPVLVTERPADAAMAREHIRTFISAFVHPQAQARWEHCLLEAPQKARGRMCRFHLDLDARRCYRLQGAESFPLALSRTYGELTGIYFDGKLEEALVVTAAEAATLASERGADALVSMVPGKRALYFDHDGVVWACER